MVSLWLGIAYETPFRRASDRAVPIQVLAASISNSWKQEIWDWDRCTILYLQLMVPLLPTKVGLLVKHATPVHGEKVRLIQNKSYNLVLQCTTLSFIGSLPVPRPRSQHDCQRKITVLYYLGEGVKIKLKTYLLQSQQSCLSINNIPSSKEEEKTVQLQLY